jgi:MerR family transcriptional regulator, light-induced transcriptional regulator
MNTFSLENASDEPLYNIGIVSRMTGVPVATLRVWERRYGFPNATRTPGGHRLCSEKEVIRLRWVKARVDEGMQTGQAIRALHYAEQEGRFPDMLVAPGAEAFHTPDPSLALFHERLTDVLLAGELAEADQLLGEVLSLYSLEDLILEIIAPTMSEIGTAWLDGKINIGIEHLSTHFLRQRLLMWMTTGPLPYVGVSPILLACAPGEWHEGSLLMMGVLLRRRRWPVAYLGQNMPLEDLGNIARKMASPAIVLVAMTEDSVQNLANWQKFLPVGKNGGTSIIGYGGLVFNEKPEWREKIGGLFLGETVREGLETLDKTLHTVVSPLG